MSMILTAMPASALIGLPIGGFIATAFGWQGVFGFIGLVAATALVFLWLLPVDVGQPSSQRVGYREGLRRVLGDRTVLKVISVTLLWASAAGGSLTYVGQFFHERYNFSSDQIGLVLMVIGVVGIIATQMGARFIGKFGTRRAVLFGIACYGLAILLLPWTGAVPVSILVLGLWVFGSWFGFPAQTAIVSELSSGARGTVLSFNTSAQYLGNVIGPVISGFVLSVGNFPLFGLWGAFLAASAFGLALRVLPGRASRLT